MTVTRLVLCRHAETDARGRVCGSLDAELSETGRGQAALLARTLEREPVAAVYASPLRRALETAWPVAAAHGLEPVAVDGLREVDFGELEGLTFAEAEAAAPEVYAAWMRDPATVVFPSGGSFADVAARAAAAIDGIRAGNGGETVVVVAHGGPLRAILAACLGLPGGAAFRLDQRPCAVNVVDWHGDEPLVRVLNAPFDRWPL